MENIHCNYQDRVCKFKSTCLCIRCTSNTYKLDPAPGTIDINYYEEEKIDENKSREIKSINNAS